MIRTFIDAWNTYKGELEEYLKITPQDQYDDYKLLVKLLFDRCINPYLNDINETKFVTNIDSIDEIDNGDYQGCFIFILHKDTYQPSVYEHVYTHNYYGSCSGCDTLQGIRDYPYDSLPNEDQIHDYMLLLLNILQQCNYFIEHDNVYSLDDEVIKNLYSKATD